MISHCDEYASSLAVVSREFTGIVVSRHPSLPGQTRSRAELKASFIGRDHWDALGMIPAEV